MCGGVIKEVLKRQFFLLCLFFDDQSSDCGFRFLFKLRVFNLCTGEVKEGGRERETVTFRQLWFV